MAEGNLQDRLRGKHEYEAADLQSAHSEALRFHTWERKHRVIQDYFLHLEVAE